MTGTRRLRACGRGPCASSQSSSSDPTRRIEPLVFAGPPSAALRAVLAVLERTPRARVLERDDTSVHAVIRSPVLRLALDLDLIVAGAVDGASGTVHLRASTPVALRERSHPGVRARQLLRSIERELRMND